MRRKYPYKVGMTHPELMMMRIARVSAIYQRIKPRMERRSKRRDRLNPIRQVMERYCFMRHVSFMSQVQERGNYGIKDYKHWHS